MSDSPTGAAARIVLSGEYDVANADTITDQVLRALDGGSARVVLDMSAVGFMDSTVLGAMIAARNACIAAGARLTVVDGSPAVRKILDLTSTGGLFDVVEADQADRA